MSYGGYDGRGVWSCYDPVRASESYHRMQQENERRMREMQERENQRRYEETQRKMQRRNEEMRRQLEAEQRVTNLVLQQSHDTTSYSSSTRYFSDADLKRFAVQEKNAPAMCKPYEERLLALIEQKYIELRSEHDKFRADFLAKNPGQEMRCKPLMDRETSFLGITIKPADRDKWYSIIGGEYLRSLKYIDDGRKIGVGYSGHVKVYSSVDGKTEYKILHKCGSKYCDACTGLAYKTKLSKYRVGIVRSPLYENGKNKRAPLSNTVNSQSPNFTIVNGQIVRTQPTFQPLPPYLRTWTFEQNGRINYDSIDGYATNDKMREIYRN